MYVTRPLSRYLANPMAAAEAPPEGPGSGFLVVVDEAAVEQAPTCCWGLCRDRRVRSLPFPQSQQLSLKQDDTPHPAETAVDCASQILDTCFNISGPGRPPGTRNVTAPDYAVFVPVVGETLSSRRYYVVRADGKHTGKVSACSREEDKTTCCCLCSITNDVPPRSFDRGDVYQQVEVQQLAPGRNGFRAVAVAGDGIPPDYLRKKKGWKVVGMASPTYDLADDAQGVDAALRARLPDGLDAAAVVVGRWYVPFMFVKADGERRLKDQFRRCTFYEMTLEQSWEQIYSRDRDRDREGAHGPAAGKEEVTVAATVRRFTALLGGTSVVQAQADSGVMWFRPLAAGTAAVGGVGVDMVLWERMRWEVDKGGWVAGNGGGDELERIERVERRDGGGGGSGQWRRFGCYLLVERFVLRRTDGSVALTCEFRFTNKIRAKWV